MNDPRDPIRFDPEELESLDAEHVDTEERPLTRDELAWELVDVLDDLSADELSELVAKNVPVETLEFFSRYASEFSEGLPLDAATGKRLSNLMLLGYLLRVLEDRLLVGPDEPFDA